MGRYFPQVNHLKEAIYVIFERQYEFINDQFAEMFGVTSEEVCQRGFDLMKLVAPESRDFIRETYRKGSRGDFSAQQYEFTGMTKDGVRIECETLFSSSPTNGVSPSMACSATSACKSELTRNCSGTAGTCKLS